jgi:hypothetical protein
MVRPGDQHGPLGGGYTDDIPVLESIIGSNSAEHFAAILKAAGGKFSTSPSDHDRISAALKDIIAGSYPSGEFEEGYYYLYAFERLCQTYAQKWTVQEIYVNEEMFPEIFDFVWGAVDDPADLPLLNDNSFNLPKSQYGPVCWHRHLKIVQQQIAALGNLDYSAIVEKNDTDYREEIAAILNVLEVAKRNNQGVFVNFAE